MVFYTAALVKEGFNSFLNLIYPQNCGICDKKLTGVNERDLSVCGNCLNKIKKNLPPYCKKCGRSLSGSPETVKVCWECFGKEFYYDRSWSFSLYEGITKEALHLLKYSGRLHLSALFCKLLIRFVKKNPEILEDINAVIAVPLHSVRLREREFNQSRLLAAAIAKEFCVEDLSGCLKRAIATQPQSKLDKKERFKNIKGTFAVTSPLSVNCKRLLLVDDLFTTGATLNECSEVLKKAGTKKINCLTFARGA